MHMKTYLTESARTASPLFDTTQIDAWQVAGILNIVAKSIEPLDAAKKALFYGREINPAVMNRLHVTDGFYGHIGARFEGLDVDLIHAILGIITEAGELAEALLKAMNTGEFDETNLREEGGDQLWYLAMKFRALGTTFEREAERNIAKLKTRFPDKFNQDEAINRDLLAEEAVLKT